MSTLRTIKKLLLGETWILPAGIATVLAAGGLLRSLAAGAWPHLGGAVLLTGVVFVLLSSVTRTARRR
jgi:hypothetical protein